MGISSFDECILSEMSAIWQPMLKSRGHPRRIAVSARDAPSNITPASEKTQTFSPFAGIDAVRREADELV
jgi:hypothetical protein